MNKNHRVVWSEHRRAFVVAHEAATSRTPGPSSSAVRSIAQAVAALTLSAASLQAFAVGCPAPVSGVVTINAVLPFGCDLSNGENVVVTSGGALSDAYALRINGTGSEGGSIQTAGYLSASGDAAILVNDLASLASINNTGTIEGLNAGLQVSNTATITGGVTNSGIIHGDWQAILVTNSSSIDGGIHNAGTLTSSYDSTIRIDTASVTGGIHNTGSIGALIQNYGTHAAAIDLYDASISGGITNSGRIELGFDGSSGIAFGIRALGSTLNGGISNSGTIIGGNADSLEGYGLVLAGSSVQGGIVNSGTIIGVGTSEGIGLHVSNAYLGSSISNSGTIIGSDTGVFLGNGSTITGSILNLASGNIGGGHSGIHLSGDVQIGGAIINAGVIVGDSRALYLDNNGPAITVINSGTLQGDVYLGVNTLNLTGTSARVIGETYGSGAVNVDGTFSSEGWFSVGSLQVAASGVFNQQHGVTVDGAVSNDGVWNLGGGARTISGDYHQSASGTLAVTLADASTYGSLLVRGDASLANGSKVFVNVVGTPTLVSGSTITGVLTTWGTLTADASKLTVNDNSALYKFTATTSTDGARPTSVATPYGMIYGDNELNLIVTADTVGLPTAVREAGFTSARGAADALQTMFNDGIPAGMQSVFDRLNNMTDAEAANAVSQTLPSITGASSQAGVNALRSMNKIIQSRVESVQGLSSGEAGADRYGWVRAFGNWSEQNNRGGVAGFKSDTGGLVVGVDAPVSDTVRAGAAFTYAKSNIKSKSSTAGSKVDVDTFQLAGYASQSLDARTDINYQIDVGQNKASSHRDISFMGTRATADFDSTVVHGSVGIGRVMPITPATSWTPSVRVDYTHMRTDGYTEEGAGPLNLDVQSQTYRELLLTGDAKASHQFEGGLKLLGNASLGYDFINKQAKTSSTFTGGGPTFVTDGLDVSPWFYRLGTALVKETGQGVEYSLRYDMEGRTSGYINQSVSAKVRWAF